MFVQILEKCLRNQSSETSGTCLDDTNDLASEDASSAQF